MEDKKMYALNLFNISNKKEYFNYLKKSGDEVEKHGGKVIAIGKYKKSVKGDLTPRNVFILVEWDSEDAFKNYIENPALKELHANRENGSSDYIWQSFDKLENFKSFFREK